MPVAVLYRLKDPMMDWGFKELDSMLLFSFCECNRPFSSRMFNLQFPTLCFGQPGTRVVPICYGVCL